MQQLSLHYGSSARIRIARGPRAAERALLAELEELLTPGGEDLQALAAPVLVVVPSTSLRRHLLERVLARSPNGAVLGLECRTHLGLAATLVERADESDPARLASPATLTGFDFFALFARRLARREKVLAASLDHLTDGYGAVLAAVRDLIDAGFDPALAEGLDEVLASEGPAVASDAEIERARALLRVAAGTQHELETWGLSRASDLLERAALAARRRSLAARRVLVHGFNDATGLTIDFLLALLQTYGGTLYLDHPPDPGDRARDDTGLTFSRHYRERVAATIPEVETVADKDDLEPPRVDTVRAQGAEAETREVARRIRRLLADGVVPERIGVVVRRLEDYASPLRAQFSRLAIPFSAGARSGPFEPGAAPLHAVLQLLREGERLPIERWLDAAALARGWVTRADLLLALHTLGAGRLGEAAALDLTRVEERGGLALAAGRGFEERDDDSGGYRASRRWVGAELLERATSMAKKACEAVDRWPGRAAAADHESHLDRLLVEILGWETDQPPWKEPGAELRRVAASLPPELELDFDELQLVLGRELADYGRGELGGAGGGVHVLDVTAARSLTFDHLFVLGLNRGVFPRQVREDPILPDPLRQVIGRSGFGVLPDLPIKRNGFHEERYLFAQLLSASPRITLSWQDVDDQQKNLRAVSPLVERLQLASAAQGDEVEAATAPPVFSPQLEGTDPRPAWEAAVLTGLAGDRAALARVLAIALGDGEGEGEGDSEGELATMAATARVHALDDADPAGGVAKPFGGLGPWLGAVGEIGEGDPRPRTDLFITLLEKLARCPWQVFLERVLRLERLPDPLEAVPGVNPRLIGLLVHDALEAIVTRAQGENGNPEWTQALKSEGVEVPWPDGEELDEILRRRAGALVAEHDLGLPGLDRALALAAARHLETARRLDWPEGHGRWPVIATEIAGFFDLPGTAGESRRIRFRADRMDRTDRGFSITDYKTGRWAPPGTATATAGERLLDGIRGGEWLQAAAYAMAGGERSSRGRYLYLSPLYDDDAGREFAVRSDQEAMVENFVRATEAILELWDRGSLFPRLVDLKDKEPKMCSFCDVSDACVRGDSGARRRLVEQIETWREAGDGAKPAAAKTILAAWELARPARARRSSR